MHCWQYQYHEYVVLIANHELNHQQSMLQNPLLQAFQVRELQQQKFGVNHLFFSSDNQLICIVFFIRKCGKFIASKIE